MLPVTQRPKHLSTDFEHVYIEPKGEIFDRLWSG